MLRIFANRGHYTPEARTALTDILKAHWTDAPIVERRVTYGNRVDLFVPVEDPRAADLHILPMKWPHYVDRNCVALAIDAVEVARRAGKPIAVFSETDSEANFPVAGRDIHLFECSAYRSRTRQTIHGMPAFITDPLKGELVIRERRQRPVVGFCGQAGTTTIRHSLRWARAQLRLAKWRLGRLKWEPPPLEHTWFRQRVLETFENHRDIETNYLLRAQYRAGLSGSDAKLESERSRREFVENVVNTDYTICVRGGGNFSVRFYEALALGRVPIFIDTDCALPYDQFVCWKDLVVWIDVADLIRAPRILADYHARTGPGQFRAMQRRARTIWQERLTPDGFYAHFGEHFPELATRSTRS